MKYHLNGVTDPDDFDERVIYATHPALSGTFLVYANPDGSHTKTPVLLWGVQQDSSVVPITFNGAWEGVINKNSFVMHPSGHCSAVERTWDNLQDALDEMSKEA